MTFAVVAHPLEKVLAWNVLAMLHDFGETSVLNLDHVMYSSDYPHTGCDWPNTRTTIERVFRGIPKDQVKKMLCDNACRLYGLDLR